MYRVKSNAVWHSLPGVVAAYQPIAAPDPFAARQNVAHNGARFGVYTAVPGVLPTWSAATGFSFVQASSQYLTTGVIPTATTTAIVRFSDAVYNPAINAPALGSGINSSANAFQLTPIDLSNASAIFGYGDSFVSRTKLTKGTIGLSGIMAYVDGRNVAAVSGTFSGAGVALFIGAHNNAGTPGRHATVNIQAIVIALRKFSPAEMWLASRQMAYCEQNPDWNAWARRRRYYYAPQAAAVTFQPAWARNANTVINQVHP